jgi:hypothetical protein
MMFTGYFLSVMMSGKLLLVNCALFLVLNTLDGYSTWLVMKPDHYERERNPIARWVFRRLKLPAGILLFKVMILSFLGVFIAYWWSEALTLNTGLLFGNLLFIIVVLHNFRVHKRYEKHKKLMQQFLSYRVIAD